MDPVVVTAGMSIAGLIITGFYLAARPTPKPAHAAPVEPAVDVEPVEELGDWDAASLAEVATDPDPLDTSVPLLAGTQLLDAALFVEVAVGHKALFEWTAPSFTQEWHLGVERATEAVSV